VMFFTDDPSDRLITRRVLCSMAACMVAPERWN
jgi:hypothetical protein